MGRGQRFGHGDRVWINRGGGLTEGTIIEVLGETEYLVAVDGQGVTEIQESAIAPREATDHPVPGPQED
jgi:hypothetical protein